MRMPFFSDDPDADELAEGALRDYAVVRCRQHQAMFRCRQLPGWQTRAGAWLPAARQQRHNVGEYCAASIALSTYS